MWGRANPAQNHTWRSKILNVCVWGMWLGGARHTDSQVLWCGESASSEEVWEGLVPMDRLRRQRQELRDCRTSSISWFCLSRGKKPENITSTVSDQELRKRELTNKETFPPSTNCVDEIPSPGISPWMLRKVSLRPSSISPTAWSSFSFAKFSMKIEPVHLTFPHIQVSFKPFLSFKILIQIPHSRLFLSL